MFSTGLKSGSPEKANVPGGPLAAMSWNQASTAGKMPALGTRMPRTRVGNTCGNSSTRANSGTKVSVPGTEVTLLAWVAGPFWRSAAVARPAAALAVTVRGVAKLAIGSRSGFWWRFCTNGSKIWRPAAAARASFASFGTT